MRCFLLVLVFFTCSVLSEVWKYDGLIKEVLSPSTENEEVPQQNVNIPNVLLDGLKVPFLFNISVWKPPRTSNPYPYTDKMTEGNPVVRRPKSSVIKLFSQTYQRFKANVNTYYSIQGRFELNETFWTSLYNKVLDPQGHEIQMLGGKNGELTVFYAHNSVFFANTDERGNFCFESIYGKWYPNSYTRLVLNAACEDAYRRYNFNCRITDRPYIPYPHSNHD